MHELAITEGILNAVLPAARSAGASRILEIRLKIGVLSGVIPACIEEYLAIAARGTLAEGARLRVETVPIRLHCNACGSGSQPEGRKAFCPVCGSRDIRITAGREYCIDSIEVE